MKHLLGLCAGVLLAVHACAAEPSRPNILLILLDDAGYGDVAGFMESASLADAQVPTPNLQQLAREGARFTRFYADSTCRPARVALLTGQQTSRVVTAPEFYGISPEVETLPEKLQQAGYRSYHIGKWHLGDNTRLAWPSAQGFDHWFGFLNQFVLRKGFDRLDDIPYHRPKYMNPWLQRDDAMPSPHQGHLEDLLADEVVNTIHQLKQSPAPWFINYWTFAPHNPATPSPAYKVRHPDTPEGQYHALLEQIDDNIGRILKALDDSGQAQNTLVLVLSDNGGTNERAVNNGPYSGVKGMYSEGGTRVPMIMRWPGRIQANSHYDGIATLYDIYPTLLAVASNHANGQSNPTEALKTDGVDLLSLLKTQHPRPPQTLFWEMATNYVHLYSVLSADGRWRLDDGRLFDLQTDPWAKTDLAQERPEVLQSLKQEFLQWRREAHRVNAVFEAQASGHSWKVSGDSFRRSPGYGGFTFVVGVAPDPAQTTGQKTRQNMQGPIAEQRGMWSLSLDAQQRIHLQMNGERWQSDPVQINACTPLVLSTYYARSKLQPKDDERVWYLLWGDQELLLQRSPHPAVFPDHFLEPTWVGQSADGEQLFSGRLQDAAFYNEFYFSNDPWQVERDPYWLRDGLCAGQHRIKTEKSGGSAQ